MVQETESEITKIEMSSVSQRNDSNRTIIENSENNEDELVMLKQKRPPKLVKVEIEFNNS